MSATAAALEQLSPPRPRSKRRAHARAGVGVVRVALLLIAALAALFAAGVPADALAPWHWSRLEQLLSRGLAALDGRWPYEGGFAQARIAVMLALPVAIVPAAALSF